MLFSTKNKLSFSSAELIFPLNEPSEILFLFPGGVPQPVMDATNYRPGMVGCIGEFSVGNVASIDMLNTALTSKNVDICQK